jgi:hypothetical protein
MDTPVERIVPLRTRWEGRAHSLGETIIKAAARGASVKDIVREQALNYSSPLSHRTPEGAASSIRQTIRRLQVQGYGVFENNETDALWLSEDGVTPYTPLDQEQVAALEAEAEKMRRNFNLTVATDLPPFLSGAVQAAMQPIEEEAPALTMTEQAAIRAILQQTALILRDHFARKHSD